jgi:hypothetical protein
MLSPVLSLPKAAEPLLSRFSIAFTPRTFQRVLLLLVGSVLTLGRHTVTRALWTVGTLTTGSGHYSDYHRVLSRARWSLWPLGRVLAAMVLELVPPDQPVVCPGDDTATQHKGKHVWGKGRHRDPCRSTASHTVWLWGHKWVVLAVNVKFFFASRPWALPVLAAFYRPKELDEKQGRRHKTPTDLARQLVAVLMHWFPQRQFILLGDGGYGGHELARFCHRHRRRLTLVSRLHPRARLFTPPPPRRKGQRGRPRLKGQQLPTPQQVVNDTPDAKRQRATVAWYGGGRRRVEFISGTGQWYRGGRGLVPLRWVFVHDLEGTHDDRYFYCTDPSLSPSRIIALYTGRWSIEVTFQEVRAHLGLATPRNWSRQSVLRTAPCLLGLFSLVCLIYHRHTRGKTPPRLALPWYAKAEPTFSDAIAAVRRLLWRETILKGACRHGGVEKLSPRIRDHLLDQLSRAA